MFCFKMALKHTPKDGDNEILDARAYEKRRAEGA